MNKKQKIVVGIALSVFALTLLAAPWTVTPPPNRFSSIVSYTTTSPVWDGPTNGRLNVATLLIEWAAIAIIAGGLFAMLRQKH